MKSKLWTGDFILILAISLLAFVTCQGLNNGTPIYVSYAGGTNAFAGALILEFSLAAALARIFIGGRIDQSSRRKIMIVGAVLLLLGTLGAVALPLLQLQVVFRAVQGFGFGAITTAASTAAADVVPSERLGEGLGYYGLGQSLGMAVGPSLAIALVSFTYHEALFCGMAVLALVLVVLGLACSYEKHPERLAETSAYRKAARELRCKSPGEGAPVEDSTSSAKASGPGGGPHELPTGSQKRPGLLKRTFEVAALPGALPMIVSCLGFSIIVNFVSKYGVQQGLAAPGVFFVCAAITMTAVRLAGGRLIDSVKPLRLLAVPIACGIACFVLLALARGEVWFYVAGGLFGLSMGLAFPLYNTVAVRSSPTERRGAASALYLLANDVGIGIGAVIWGSVIDAIGYVPAFWGGVAMLAGAYLVTAAVFPREAQEGSDA